MKSSRNAEKSNFRKKFMKINLKNWKLMSKKRRNDCLGRIKCSKKYIITKTLALLELVRGAIINLVLWARKKPRKKKWWKKIIPPMSSKFQQLGPSKDRWMTTRRWRKTRYLITTKKVVCCRKRIWRTRFVVWISR